MIICPHFNISSKRVTLRNLWQPRSFPPKWYSFGWKDNKTKDRIHLCSTCPACLNIPERLKDVKELQECCPSYKHFHLMYRFHGKSAIRWRWQGKQKQQRRRKKLKQAGTICRWILSFACPTNLLWLSNKVKAYMYTLKRPAKTHRNLLTKPRENPPKQNASHHVKRGKKLRGNIWSHVRVKHHSHVQNTLSLQYTTGGKHRKRTVKRRRRKRKITMYLVTPRGTQCDTLCIIASIFPLIFATEWREKVNFVLKWHLYHVHL